MITDHFYSIGKTHQVCEDFALSGVRTGDSGEQVAYAIVCDGCSSGEGVDFGARALAYAAKSVVVGHDNFFFDVDPEYSFRFILGKAASVQTFSLPPSALDATLLVAAIRGSRCRIVIWGDGVAAVKTPSERFRWFQVDYSSNAPYYLSYMLSSARQQTYRSQYGNGKKTYTAHLGGCEPAVTTVEGAELYRPVLIDLPVEKGFTVSLISDGITQFRKPDTEIIPVKDLIHQFTGFKNLTEEFATRRAMAMLREHAKAQITHDDDISIASITCPL